MRSVLSMSLLGACLLASAPLRAGQDAFLSWDEEQAVAMARATRANGRVGGFFDLRVTSTRSYNYKLRATWMTPEVIRATARLSQLQLGLTDAETLALVTEAEALGDTVVMVEIDPREGSGVIPRDWMAWLRPKGRDDSEGASGARGELRPEGRRLKALAGAYERDYAYDVFWLSFSLVDASGAPLLPSDAKEAELVVRIAGKEGRVDWTVPSSLRK